MHNYRKRLKDDPVKYEAYKLKDKKRKQQARKKAKRIPVCTSDAARKRKLNRERVRRFRRRKKAEERRKNNAKPTEKEEEPGYKTPQALGKAFLNNCSCIKVVIYCGQFIEKTYYSYTGKN